MVDIMTSQETADYLKITLDYLYRIARRGEIPAFHIGDLWRFRKSEIDQWLKKQ
jgi:excisionase family DNA binding protein